MSNQQVQPPWMSIDLYSEELRSTLKSSKAIDDAQVRIYALAHARARDGLLSEQDFGWLLRIAYNALGTLAPGVRHEEYIAHQRQEASQQTDAILAELREIPPYEPVPVPGWLQELQQEGG